MEWMTWARTTARRWVGIALLLPMALAWGQASPLGADVSGGKDLPWLSRFSGSQLIGHETLDFGQGTFYATTADKPVVSEGRVSRLLYIVPLGKTAVEVHRNFEQALKQAGLTVIASGDGSGPLADAGRHWRANFSKLVFARPFAADIAPFNSEGLYLYGTLKRGGSELAVSVFTGETSVFTRDHYKAKNGQPLAAVAIQVVEPKAMQTGQVTVSADALRKGLEADGKIALYGIYFDSGKAELKAESKPQLEQMAALLKQQAALRVFIVGHTDNQGGADANVALSQQRAQAVVGALVKDYGVDAKRLAAKGVAGFAPVASNAGEEGRGRNRRVEMVVQ